RVLARVGRGTRFGSHAHGYIPCQRGHEARLPLVRVPDDGKRGRAHATASWSAATRSDGSPIRPSLSRHGLNCAGVAATRLGSPWSRPTGRTMISDASPLTWARRACTKSTNSISGGSHALTTTSTSPGPAAV